MNKNKVKRDRNKALLSEAKEIKKKYEEQGNFKDQATGVDKVAIIKEEKEQTLNLEPIATAEHPPNQQLKNLSQEQSNQSKAKEDGAMIKVEEQKTQSNEGKLKMGTEAGIATAAPKTVEVKAESANTGTNSTTDTGIVDVDKFLSEGSNLVQSVKDAIEPTATQWEEIRSTVSQSNLNPYSGNQINVSYTGFVRAIKIRNKFPCHWKRVTINIASSRRQIWSYEIKIKKGNKNYLDFIKSKMTLCQEIIAEYDGIYQDVAKVENVYMGIGRITDPNSAGLKLDPSVLTDLNESEMEAFRREFKYNQTISDVYNADGTQNYKLRKHNAFVERREEILIRGLQASYKPLFLENGIDRKRAFFKLLDNKFRYLVPKPATLKEDWVYVIHDPYKWTSPFRFLLDNNLIMKEWVRKIGSEIISKTLDIPTITANATMKQISQQLGLNANLIQQVNNIPGEITPSKAATYMQNLFNVWMNRNVMEMFIPMSFELTTDVTLLIDCIANKCYSSYFQFNFRTPIDIDNYLFQHLFKNMPDLVKLNRMESPSQMDYMNGNRNYLKEFLTGRFHVPNTWGPDAARIIQDFFLTTNSGSGWLSADGIDAVEIDTTIPDYEIFMNQRDCRYAYYTGRPTKIGELPLQMIRFSRLVSLFKGIREFIILPGQARFSFSLVSMLTWMEALGLKLSVMIVHMNERLQDLSLVSLWDPLRPANIKDDNTRLQVRVETWSIISAVALIDHYKLGPILLDPKYIELGWRFHEYFDQLCANKVFVDELKEFEIIPRTTRIKLAMDMTTPDPGFAAFFQTEVAGTPHFEEMIFPLPTNQFWAIRIRLAYAFIESMKGLMGYVDKWYYYGAGIKSIKNLDFEAYFPFQPKGISKVFNYEEFKEAVYTDITDTIILADDNRQAIQFNVPIYIESLEMKDLDATQPNPFTDHGGMAPLELGTLNWLYQFYDDYLNRRAPVVAWNRKPRFYVDVNQEPNVRDGLINRVLSHFKTDFYVFLPEWKQYLTMVFAKRDPM